MSRAGPILIPIGIDGGASTTRARRTDPSGKPQTSTIPHPSSLTLGVPEAWRHIQSALHAIGIGSDAYETVHLACALAGSRRTANRTAFFAAAPRFAALTLCSDGHATVLGAHAGRPGAAIAIGTGIVGNALTADGTARQVGGWGFPARDEASGAWLGLQAIAETLRLLDAYPIEPTPLHRAILATAGPDPDSLADWLYQAPSTRYAALAPLVVTAAQAGDPAALRLLRHAAEEVERLADALDPSATLPLCLAGSLAPPILAHASERLASRVQPAQGDACDGALLIARRLARSDLPP